MKGTVHRLVADLSRLPDDVFVCNRLVCLALAADAIKVRHLLVNALL